MRFDATLIALVAPLLVSAAPIRRQAASQDLLVLNFAEALEQLETQFYGQVLQNSPLSDLQNAGFSNPNVVIEQITAIQSDEATHASTLASVIQQLGGTPISGCNFDFSNVLTDVSTMIAAARVIESVGIGAYLGAAHLITDPSLLTSAASILTTEARHETVLNILSGNGTAIPQAFDIALQPQGVLAIVGQFLSGCDVGITANQPLTVNNAAGLQPGDQMQLSSPAVQNNDFSGLSCQLIVGGAAFSMSLNLTSDGQGCTVPNGVNGPLAVYLTNSSQPLDANIVDMSTENQVAGPTMLFIDTDPEVLGQLARNTGASISSSTVVSPAEASSIASSGSSSSSNSGNSSSSNSGSSSNGSSSSTASSSSSTTSSNSSSSSTAGSSSSTLSSDSSSSSSSGNASSTTTSSGSASTSSSSNNGTVSTGTVNAGGSANVTGATASSSCGANPQDTNNAVSLGGMNNYTGPSANCVFTIGPITNQTTLTASPFINDTTVSGTVAPTIPAAAAATGALAIGSASGGPTLAVLTSSLASALTASPSNA